MDYILSELRRLAYWLTIRGYPEDKARTMFVDALDQLFKL